MPGRELQRQNSVCAHRPAKIVCLRGAAAAFTISCSLLLIEGAGMPPSGAQVQDQDLKSLSEDIRVKQWKPGDPVRVVPDLREEGGQPESEALPPLRPTVHGPVAPQILEQDLGTLPKIKPHGSGDPVRVVPDLKESN